MLPGSWNSGRRMRQRSRRPAPPTRSGWARSSSPGTHSWREIEADYAAALTAAEALRQRRIADKAVFDAQIDQLIGSGTLTYAQAKTQFEAAKTALIAKYKAEIETVERAYDAAVAARKARYNADLAALSARVTALKNLQSAELATMATEFAAAVNVRKAEDTTRLNTLKADLAALQAEMAQVLADLQTTGASSSDITAITVAYNADINQLRPSSPPSPPRPGTARTAFKAEYDARVTVTKAGHADAQAALGALKTQLGVNYNADLAALKVALTADTNEIIERGKQEALALVASYAQLQEARRFYDQIVAFEYGRTDDTLKAQRDNRVREANGRYAADEKAEGTATAAGSTPCAGLTIRDSGPAPPTTPWSRLAWLGSRAGNCAWCSLSTTCSASACSGSRRRPAPTRPSTPTSTPSSSPDPRTTWPAESGRPGRP